MPDLPPAAITAAVAAYAREAYVDGEPIEGDERVIRAALEAAAPAMADHIAKAILRHSDEHEPPLESRQYLAWHRHFSIAARVAANAFYTDEDMKRLAAEAMARGEFAVCDIPEVPREVGEDDSSGR